MARVKINVVIERLDYQIKGALEDAVSNTIPGATFDTDKLWLEFVRALNKKCSTWSIVPDSYVKKG